MILLLTLNAHLYRKEENFAATDAALPDPTRTVFCQETGGQLGDRLVRLGLRLTDFIDREDGIALLDAHFRLCRGLVREKKTARQLIYFAVHVGSLAEGGKMISALLAINAEFVLGFEFKSGSVQPHQCLVDLSGGFPLLEEEQAS